MSKRLIDKDNLCDDIEDKFGDEVEDFIDDYPSFTMQDIWPEATYMLIDSKVDEHGFGYGVLECSNCHFLLQVSITYNISRNYCPNCGYKMNYKEKEIILNANN